MTLMANKRKINNNNLAKLVAMIMVAMLGLMLCACGKEDDTTRIEISKEGAVKSVISENFTEPNYDINELSELATSDIADYNSEYLSTKISLDSLKYNEKTGMIKMIMSYNSAYDYAAFNHETLFYGTVTEAVEKGYQLSGDMVGTGDDKLPDDWKEEYKDKHIVICEEKIKVKTPYKIEYTTQGVNVKGKKEAVLSEESGDMVQLLLSK